MTKPSASGRAQELHSGTSGKGWIKLHIRTGVLHCFIFSDPITGCNNGYIAEYYNSTIYFIKQNLYEGQKCINSYDFIHFFEDYFLKKPGV